MLGLSDKAVVFEKIKENVKLSRPCYVRATSLLRSCCVLGVATDFYVRVRYVRAAFEGFPVSPRYVRAD